MLTLGFCGGPNAAHEKTFDLFPGGMHDSAAVLLRGGEVVAAIEQERLDRIKHSNKGAFDAIRFCLTEAGASIDDLAAIAFYGDEAFWDGLLREYFLAHPEQSHLLGARALLSHVLSRELGSEVAPELLDFVPHHRAHAVSAAIGSGFDRCLVLSLDGQGDELAGLVARAEGDELEILEEIPVARSLGYYYLRVIAYLGYRIFDEYKVMGLAPYGDRDRFRELFDPFYSLEENGGYRLHWSRLEKLHEVITPRRPGEPFEQIHKDLAAALQESLERIVFHLVEHYRRSTGLTALAYAGGVAHNCSLNGRLLASGLFERMFVHPASHDAGCALGAALDVARRRDGAWAPRPARHVFWGRDLGDREQVGDGLARWQDLVEVEPVDDPCEAAADLIASGAVIGWVQGRSEFGPRALGNRSILADPRPAENKSRINAMVKKREAYRPFAPSVPVERAADFFDLPPGADFQYMVFTVEVREDQRETLGAITHVDGTARIQTVDRETNPRYWELIEAFGRRTGVPVVLNTSFNNHAEPIVDSLDDAVTCFLTTGLDVLVAGDYVVRKRPVDWRAHLDLVLELPPHVALAHHRRFVPPAGWTSHFELVPNTGTGRSATLSEAAFEVLAAADGERTLGELTAAEPAARQAVVERVLELWGDRLVRLGPAAGQSARTAAVESAGVSG